MKTIVKGYVGEAVDISIFDAGEIERLQGCRIKSGSKLPMGLVLDSTHGHITGIPTAIYRQTITLAVKWKTGEEYLNLLILIKEARTFSLLTDVIPEITALTPFEMDFIHQGGTEPVKYTSSTLPKDLTLSEDGHLSGIVQIGGGVVPIVITATDREQRQISREFRTAIKRKTI